MLVIDAFDEPVRSATVSPDGRFLAAVGGFEVGVWSWLSGERVARVTCPTAVGAVAFTADGNWAVFAYGGGLFRLATAAGSDPIQLSGVAFSGGIAIAPDGKTLAASGAGSRQHAQLYRWELPAWRSATGFDYWSPFRRLAFSPNGEFLAGIDADTFELRIAVTGGLNGRHRVRYVGDGFFSFPRDSQTVVFGWETDLHVMDTRNGQVSRRVASPGEPFADAAFLGNGRQLATVDGSPLVRVWSAESWEVTRGYDWAAGGLSCVTATADGLAAVCGTDTGKLVVFDVDD
jgi:WD40 repeat protein